jgi:serine phosphatase RsbU (regulator of sigma subunit)
VRDAGLEPIASSLALAGGEEISSDGRLLVASAPVRHRDGRRIGTAMVGLKRNYLDHLLARARREQTVVLAVVLVFGIALAFVLMSLVLRPLQTLRAGIERIGGGDLDTPLRLRDRTELGVLADAVNDMAAALKRAQAEMVERERLTREVELARQIQTSLLPNRGLHAGPFTIAGSQRAAAEVGGDYFDYFRLPDGRIGIAVADVSGKGLAGCLVMSMLSALLRAYRTTHASPASMLAVLDERLGETLQSGSFVTMFYAVLDPETGALTYASAGHSPLLVYRRAENAVEWFKSTGIPLGAIRGGAIRRTLRDATLTLAPGDQMVQFTDGINEAFDARDEEQFGFTRMEYVVTESAPKGCDAVIAALHLAIERWSGAGPASDDETVLVVGHEGAADRTIAAGSLRAQAVPGGGPEAAISAPGAPPGTAPREDPGQRLAEARRRGECLRLPASLDVLPRIREWLTGRLPSGHAEGNRFELLTTALYEACANIVEHGYKLDAARHLELWWVPGTASAAAPGSAPEAGETHSFGGDGYFLIRDQGIAFRADNWKQTDFSDPTVWKRGRGFGLDIIYRTMRHVAYHPGTPEGNITLMSFAPEFGREDSHLG